MKINTNRRPTWHSYSDWPSRAYVSDLDVESETWPALILLIVLVLHRADNNRIPDREKLSLDV